MNHILALILIVGSLALAQEPKPPDQPPAPDAAALGPKQPAPPKIKTMEEAGLTQCIAQNVAVNTVSEWNEMVQMFGEEVIPAFI